MTCTEIAVDFRAQENLGQRASYTWRLLGHTLIAAAWPDLIRDFQSVIYLDLLENNHSVIIRKYVLYIFHLIQAEISKS